ncbi:MULTISPECIES: MATE family efflux transporter DinF [Salinivibrio]|uniref:MATE family efflux transporter DinF n=1 Tax=Salinivibrio TaxID=51366 RepID=UPI000E3130FD|nr:MULTISPECIES: MATE family efflux transporter DinF [Salinivibrio]WBA18020.1 MATE family efflux transporter DinF [Salinivibrio kushneri]
MWQSLTQRELHWRVLSLALPMVISNITVPLLGLVDAAVIGHLEHAWYLGGVAVGSTMINVTFWLLGFLRMATTGFTAQAYGANDNRELAATFVRGATLAGLLATLLIALHVPILEGVMHFSDASAEVKHHASQYFSIRIFSAPATLMNLVVMGWLLGAQNARQPMWLLIVVNSANIILDLLFVVGLDMKVEGAAAASVVADYLGLMLGLYFVKGIWQSRQLPTVRSVFERGLTGMSRLLKLNRDIFLRSLSLQLAFTFMTFQGATLGDEIVAANAVLMSFLMLISFAMDGFAYAMEAMVGKAVGAQSKSALLVSLIGSTFWSLVICLAITLAFGVAGHHIIALISDIEAVRDQAARYLPWLVAMPLVSMWCFLLDGIFIGATRGKDMRNGMFVATAGFFAAWWLAQGWGNHALWLAMLTFMALRGLSLAVCFVYHWRRDSFFDVTH